ncbi:MAG: site-2 protease family protein [Candidatus Methanoplasma sp.]|nr:site-2 protease family protein [Candidatus Methanoplasma sp.]
MELTYWILLMLAVVYVPIYVWVWRSPTAKKYGLVKYGPCIMIKTRLGTSLMERWSKYKRFWRLFGIFSIIVSLCLMVFIVYILIIGLLNLPTSLNSSGLGIEYALAIPGINPLMSGKFFWYAILGLFVAMVIHELAHGFQTRANDMRVDSTGALYGVVPLGAFVEPNEEDIGKSTRRAKLDLYSAGITTNFLGAITAFFIFAVLMMGGISSDFGDNTAVYKVTGDSPALEAGIPASAIILTVDGQAYYYNGTNTVDFAPGSLVSVEYITESSRDTPISTTIQWGVFIENVTGGSPADGKLMRNTFIRSITIDGEKTQFYDMAEFLSFMKTTSPGDVAAIEYVGRGNDNSSIDSSSKTETITLGNNGGIGYIGVSTTTSGMRLTTPNVTLEIGRNPIYGADGIVGVGRSLISYITGPMIGYSPIPSGAQWWFDVPLGGAFWIIVSAFYWIFWLNVMLGVSNAIPAIPFDGGFIFQGGLSAILERLKMKDEKKREELVSRITGSFSMIMIFVLIVVIAVAVIPR